MKSQNGKVVIYDSRDIAALVTAALEKLELDGDENTVNELIADLEK